MKKLVLVLLIMVSICCSTLFAVEKKGEETPVIKEAPGFWYACMEFQNPFDDMQGKINKFLVEFRKQGLRATGPSLTIHFNSHIGVNPEEVKWAFGRTVAKGTVVKEPIKLVEFKPTKAVVHIHKGSYQTLPQSANDAVAFARREGYDFLWPYYDKYLNSPGRVKPEDLKTEIIIPVKKSDCRQQ